MNEGFCILGNRCYGNPKNWLFLVTIATVANYEKSLIQFIDFSELVISAKFQAKPIIHS